MEFFIKWDNFLKEVETESVLYTCCVANKRSIFSSLILIFVKHCGCQEQVYCFFSIEPHNFTFIKYHFSPRIKWSSVTAFSDVTFMWRHFPLEMCNIVVRMCESFIPKNKLNWENKVNKASFEMCTIENNYRNM